MKNNQPLFLPKGSIRAILALGMTGWFLACLWHKIVIEPQYITIWAGILGWYFGGRSDFNTKKPEE